MAHIKEESYGLAIADAELALELDPQYVKAYYRRGSGLFALHKYKQALKDFKHVCRLQPKDPQARRQYAECEKQAKEAAFARAIESEETAPFALDSARINDGSYGDLASKRKMVSYAGVRSRNGGILQRPENAPKVGPPYFNNPLFFLFLFFFSLFAPTVVSPPFMPLAIDPSTLLPTPSPQTPPHTKPNFADLDSSSLY